jgi:hypothetical protein
MLSADQRMFFDALDQHVVTPYADETLDDARQREVSSFFDVLALEGIPLPSREDVLAEMDARRGVR